MAAILFAAKILRYEKCEESLDLEKDEDVLNDIRLELVDRPEYVGLDNHRFLSRCACQMEMITTVIRDYSRSSSKIDCGVLDATLEYGLKAQTFINMLYVVGWKEIPNHLHGKTEINR